MHWNKSGLSAIETKDFPGFSVNLAFLNSMAKIAICRRFFLQLCVQLVCN